MSEKGFVYVIHAVGTNRIKIGYSADPPARVKDLQTGSPFPLELVRQWEGGPSDEAYLHRQYEGCRIHLEWFEVPVDLAVMFIGQYFQMKAHPPEPVPELPFYIAELVRIKTLASKHPISDQDGRQIFESAGHLMKILDGRLSPELQQRMVEIATAMAEQVAIAA